MRGYLNHCDIKLETVTSVMDHKLCTCGKDFVPKPLENRARYFSPNTPLPSVAVECMRCGGYITVSQIEGETK